MCVIVFSEDFAVHLWNIANALFNMDGELPGFSDSNSDGSITVRSSAFRKCGNSACQRRMSKEDYDPHSICVTCRGIDCTSQRCDECITWSQGFYQEYSYRMRRLECRRKSKEKKRQLTETAKSSFSDPAVPTSASLAPVSVASCSPLLPISRPNLGCGEDLAVFSLRDSQTNDTVVQGNGNDSRPRTIKITTASSLSASGERGGGTPRPGFPTRGYIELEAGLGGPSSPPGGFQYSSASDRSLMFLAGECLKSPTARKFVTVVKSPSEFLRINEEERSVQSPPVSNLKQTPQNTLPWSALANALYPPPPPPLSDHFEDDQGERMEESAPDNKLIVYMYICIYICMCIYMYIY